MGDGVVINGIIIGVGIFLVEVVKEYIEFILGLWYILFKFGFVGVIKEVIVIL